MKGCPEIVNGIFCCTANQLKSLKYGPKSAYNYSCDKNQLSSLEGSPHSVGGYYVCSRNPLKSLEGSPVRVGGSFECNRTQITNFKGCPKYIGGSLYARNNPLETLEHLEHVTIKRDGIYSFVWDFDELWKEGEYPEPLPKKHPINMILYPEHEWESKDSIDGIVKLASLIKAKY